MPGRSRWLVGSSSSSRSGRRASSRARASRFRQPPERASAGWSGSAKPDLRQRDGGPGLALVVLERLVGEGGEHDLAGGLAGGEGVVLGEVADAGAAAGGAGAGVGLLAAGEQPAAASTCPAPLGPISPTRSPARRSSDRSVNSGRAVSAWSGPGRSTTDSCSASLRAIRSSPPYCSQMAGPGQGEVAGSLRT